ncbi:MAG: aminotransferase class I/II-fold pyridoxal phosphate-dependent enzyme [Nitrospiraceae bacterium]|nr:aminotransferase class I/II-fold pyridoxal phosphate-dependent enzyme [Nitrospiraceae bacterium]
MKDNEMTNGRPVAGRGRIIDVSAGVCPLGPSRRVKTALRKAIKEIGVSADDAVRRLERFFFSKYGVPAGSLLFANSLRELSGALLASRGPKKVLVAGALPGLYGEETPGASIKPRYLVSGEAPFFAAGPDELMRAAGEADVVIVSNPDRVTGRLLGDGVLTGLRDMAGKGKLELVIDETLMEFTGREGIAAQGKNVTTLRTTASYYGLAGLELAYAVSGAETIAGMRTRRCSAPNRLSVEAAKAALSDGAYKTEVKRLLDEEKLLLSRAFGRDGRITFFDSDANVYLLGFKGWCEQFSSCLLRAGFIVREYRPAEDSDAPLLRMSVLAHDKNVKLARLICGMPPSGGALPVRMKKPAAIR